MASAGGVRAGKAYVELGIRDKTRKALRGIGKRLAQFAAAAGKGALMIAAAGVAAAGFFVTAAKKFAAFGDTLNKMSLRTGIAASALSELRFAAQQSGTDLGTVEKAVKRMQGSILDLELGLSTAKDGFGMLGLSLEDIKGKSPEEQFKLISERIAAIEDPTTRAAVAMKVLGKSGVAMLPMINNMAELREEAKALGIVMSEDDAFAAASLQDAFGRVGQQLEALWNKIGAAVAGPMEDMLTWFSEMLTSVLKFIDSNRVFIETLGTFLTNWSVFSGTIKATYFDLLTSLLKGIESFVKNAIEFFEHLAKKINSSLQKPVQSNDSFWSVFWSTAVGTASDAARSTSQTLEHTVLPVVSLMAEESDSMATAEWASVNNNLDTIFAGREAERQARREQQEPSKPPPDPEEAVKKASRGAAVFSAAAVGRIANQGLLAPMKETAVWTRKTAKGIDKLTENMQPAVQFS